MAKDRAAPFSRKHRKYWIPVTGGMLLIGAINVTLGVCTYHTPVEPTRIDLHIPGYSIDAGGTLGPAQLPAVVMRAFAVKYPRTIPSGVEVRGSTFVLGFPAGAAHRHATFRDDGTFVSDD